jgi:nucleotide-binding universal stress UspA family protein
MKTKTVSKVLIALDFNPTAQKVAEQGYALAKAIGAKVILLHVVPNPMNFDSTGHVMVMGFGGYPQTELGNLKVDSEFALKKVALEYLEKSKIHLKDKNIEAEVKEGEIAESIMEVAKDMHVDLIVLGSHSQKWLENIVMGSVAEKVLRLTAIPLYIIPTKKID